MRFTQAFVLGVGEICLAPFFERVHASNGTPALENPRFVQEP